MRTTVLWALPWMLFGLAASSSLHAQEAAQTQRPEVEQAAKALHEKLVRWRRDFHQNPELSNREQRTAAKVAAHLRSLGLQPRTGLAHHGVSTVIKGGRPGPRIALRADMDALPVTEETGLPFASKATSTPYRGQTVGVGSRPWSGVDPIVASADLIGTAQTIVSRRTHISRLPAVVTFGAIDGGIRHNIIPDDVELLGTIRSFDEDMRQKLFADLRTVSEHVAAAHGARAEVDIERDDGNPPTINDPALTARALPSLRAAVGADNVFEPPLQMGSEDFSLYGQQAPALFFFVGATARDVDPVSAPSNHSPRFQLDEQALDVGFRALLQVSLDYLHAGAAPTADGRTQQ